MFASSVIDSSEADSSKVASCCCRQCQITVTAAPVLSAVCHCDDCKRRTGSAFGLNSYFKQEDVHIQASEASVYHLDSALGEQFRYFCRHCGSTLYWRVAIYEGLVGIASGCFDGQMPQPMFNAQPSGQCQWLSLAAEVDQPLTMAALQSAMGRAGVD